MAPGNYPFMNGSEIEQSATTVSSVAMADYEEPPSSKYQTSTSFAELPVFQPPPAERRPLADAVKPLGAEFPRAELPRAEFSRVEAGVNRAPPRRLPSAAARTCKPWPSAGPISPTLKTSTGTIGAGRTAIAFARWPTRSGSCILTDDETAAISTRTDSLPVGITPYYASLLDEHDRTQRLRRTVVPVMGEFCTRRGEADDPLGEDADSPTPGLVHRYPDRVLLLVTGFCSMYCRYCTRSRLVGHGEIMPNEARLEKAIDYIAATPAGARRADLRRRSAGA